MSISLKNLNAFIIEILTIDYSYFWQYMEYAILTPESFSPSDSNPFRVSVIIWENVTFIPFAESKKVKDFFPHEEPPAPSFDLYQRALTDLLTLSEEQKQAQIARLLKIYDIWSNDSIVGISEDGDLYDTFKYLKERPAYSTKKPPLSFGIVELTYLDYKVYTKNMPEDDSCIYVGIEFYDAYVKYINLKITAINALIENSDIRQQLQEPIDEIESNKPARGRKVTVFIKNDSREYFKNELSLYVDEDNQISLSHLVGGESIGTPVTVYCKQNVLGEIFYRAYENGLILCSKTTLAEWICQNFQRQTDGQIYKLTYSTMVNHLKGVGLSKD